MLQKIALIAHDQKKELLASWVGHHHAILRRFGLVATGGTGRLLSERFPDLAIERVASGPHGGDQQVGARIVSGEVAALFFFIDPLTPMPHDVDVKALIRLATLYDIPCATSPSTANLVIDGLLPTRLPAPREV